MSIPSQPRAEAREEHPSGLVILNPTTMFDPTALGYSQVAIAPAGARTVYVAGQTGGARKGTFADQCRAAFESIDTAMHAAGGSIADVAKLTIYIVLHDEAKKGTLVAEVRRAFGGKKAPTCTIVPLTQSGLSPNQLVEIEAVGVLMP